MSIDWAATGQMLTGIGTIGSGLAIVGAAFLARRAAADFSKQRRAEKRLDHAESALAIAYQLDAAASSLRSPLSTTAELADSEAELSATDWFSDLDDEMRSRTIQSNIFYQRIRATSDVFRKGLDSKPFIKAHFGEEAEAALQDLIAARHKVRVYADAYAKDRGHSADFTKTIESHIWEGAISEGGTDPIQNANKVALEKLEGLLIPIVRGEDAIGKQGRSSSDA